ncbi:MAG: hypothetical protein JNM39_04460 [Bdellovibrionaceae bacterium]|nr:hypothetical protein [Pseudobdellovibrionaceae bacterium]
MYKIILISFFWGPSLWAGGWVFGGGSQIGDTFNPWFLNSTRPVTYCVSLSEKSVSISRERAEQLIAKSLEYWRWDFQKLFEIVKEPPSPIAEIKPPMQGFQKIDCQFRADLNFLIGEEALSLEQKNFLKDIDLIAGSVRTDYDPKAMKGRGFIYLKSDLGPESFVRKDQIERPWEKDGIFLRVLIHELGHVFGLQHTDRGLMMAQYPETIMKKTLAPGFLSAENIPSTLLPSAATSFGALDFKTATVVDVDRNIQIISASSEKFLAFPRHVPSGLTLEWNLQITTPEGQKKPVLVRISPFLYEVYSLADGHIVQLKREYRQCRGVTCISD